MNTEHLAFNKETRLFPIIGFPMGQSSAAFAYNPLFAANNINEIMWPVEIKPGGLGEFIAAARTLGIRHFTLTMPHKSKIIPFLDEVEEESRICNSVNIVKFLDDGRAVGAGMDGRGNLAALRNAGVDVRNMRVTIIGAGSIGGGILLQLAKAGAKSVTLANRSPDRAKELSALMARHVSLPIACVPLNGESLKKAAAESDLLMQSTPLGMVGVEENYPDLDFIDCLPAGAVAMENIVNPPRTLFAARAEARGLKVVYGIDMLLGQLGEIFHFCYGYYPEAGHLQAAREGIYGFFGLKT